MGLFCSPHSVHRAHAGESERVLREAFSEASSHAMSGKPSVVFIDEIDALCPRRDFRYGDVEKNLDVSLPHHLIFRLIRRGRFYLFKVGAYDVRWVEVAIYLLKNMALGRVVNQDFVRLALLESGPLVLELL